MQSTYLISELFAWHVKGNSNPTGRIRNINVCGVHRILPSDQIVSSIPDDQVFGRRGKYINDPYILKEVAIIHAFLHEAFPHVWIKHKWN